MVTFDLSFWQNVHNAELTEWRQLEAAAQNLLADDWARTKLERIEAGDRLKTGGAESDWRRLIEIADLKSILDLPYLGVPIDWWVTSPAVFAARKMLGQPPDTPLCPEFQKVLQDGVYPSFLWKLALDQRYPHNFARQYFIRKRWHLSTILPAWSDYATYEDMSAITRDLEEELDMCCDFGGEVSDRVDDLVKTHLMHHGVVSGDCKMFVIPFAMDKAGVDVRDIAAMREAISATPHWQCLFREYGHESRR